MYEKVKKYWEYVVLFLAISAALGITAKFKNLIHQLQISQTFIEVAQDGLRSIMDLKATGHIIEDKEKLKVEVRRLTTVDRVTGKPKEVNWIFILRGHGMYSAIPADIDGGYYFMNAKEERTYVQDLKYDKYYLRDYVDGLPREGRIK